MPGGNRGQPGYEECTGFGLPAAWLIEADSTRFPKQLVAQPSRLE